MHGKSESIEGGRHKVAGQQALAAVLLQRQSHLWPRFLSIYARLRRLPRGWKRQIYRKTAVTLAGAALLLALGRAPTLHAASITVDGSCTLVDAILSAEHDGQYGQCYPGDGADTIYLDVDVNLTTPYDILYESKTALPLVTTTITIEGAGHTIERDAGATEKFRLFAVSTTGNLTLNEVMVSGGYAYPEDLYYSEGEGGAIFNRGIVTLTDSTISDNEARDSGGAIASRGVNSQLTITNTAVTGNKSRYDGGAIYSFGGQVTVTNSTFTGNGTVDGGYGGAIGADGNSTLIITGGTFSDNYADTAGAVWGNGTTTITNSTITGNSATDFGGGIFVDKTFTIRNSTITLNEAEETGGGIYVDDGATFTLTDSTISHNTAGYDSGGIKIDGAGATISNTTISDNSGTEYGGGLSNVDGAETTLTNSTISGNSVAGPSYGGGIYNRYSTLTITNSTITDNTSTTAGGGIFNGRYEGSAITLVRSLISGNHAPSGSELHNHSIPYGTPGSITAANHNLFGYSGIDNNAAFTNFTPGATDINATSSGDGIPLEDILYGALEPNSGPQSGSPGNEEPILTHRLVTGSPAIDKAPNLACNSAPTNRRDQRGYARNANGDGGDSPNECDIGAFEYASAPLQAIYMTAAGPGTIGGLSFGKEDILFWSGLEWSKHFDGTDAGLTNKHDLNAIHINGEDDLYLSFFQNKIKTTTLGNVFGQDILHYDGNDFTLFFDGSDVGLTTTAEKIDALHILDDGSGFPGGGSCGAYLLISTLGTGKVPAAGGGQLKFQGEDILGFCLTNAGNNTAGFWHLVLDGSAEGMPKNSTDSISANDDGSVIYLTTQATFNVDNASGGHSMVYKLEGGHFSGPHFSAPANGLNQKVDGLHLEDQLP